MANQVYVEHTYADGATTVVKVKADNAYPDALDEAQVIAIRTLIEAHVTTRPDNEPAPKPKARKSAD